MTAFTDMAADLFDNDDLAVDAVYRPLEGEAFAVRAIRRYADRNVFSGIGLESRGQALSIPLTAISAVTEGDQIAICFTLSSPEVAEDGFWESDKVCRIRGGRRDDNGLMWRLDIEGGQ
jgi:hypothetical protein